MNDSEAVVFFRAGADRSVGDCVLAPKHHRNCAALKRRAAGIRDAFLDEVYGTGAVYLFLCVKAQCSGRADSVPGFKLLGRLEQGRRAAGGSAAVGNRAFQGNWNDVKAGFLRR